MADHRIRAILFDLDGTLRLNLPSGGEVFSSIAASLGLPISGEDSERAARWEHYYWASSRSVRQDIETYRDNDAGFWRNYTCRRLLALCGSPSLSAELAPQVSQYMDESYHPASVPAPGIYPALDQLRDAGFSLGVVSNRRRPYREELDVLGLSEYFPFVLAAGEVDLWKPDPALFQHTARQLGIRPEQAVYVGDNYFADVVGARRAGWRPVLYDARGLFHEPGCPVIDSFEQLPEQIERMNSCGDSE